MPVLKNARHELFAQGIAQGKIQSEAYIDAGYSEAGAGVAGCKLLKNPKVDERVRELQSKMAQKAMVTAESLMQRGLQLLDKAELSADFKSASQTLERVAKIGGFWVDKTQSEGGTSLNDFLSALK